MPSANYTTRRGQIHDYFDRTAVETWARMTSDAPLSGIRETVRQGRQRMFDTIMSWLPSDLDGTSIYDAGCGAGKLSIELAQRGANVLAVDLSPKLIDLANKRTAKLNLEKQITFSNGDMLSPGQEPFDHVIAMDSLIHYDHKDALDAIDTLTRFANTSLLFTFAPRTPMLSVMHSVGKLFPRSDRAPSIEPMTVKTVLSKFSDDNKKRSWRVGRMQVIKNGFYISQAVELVRR